MVDWVVSSSNNLSRFRVQFRIIGDAWRMVKGGGREGKGRGRGRREKKSTGRQRGRTEVKQGTNFDERNMRVRLEEPVAREVHQLAPCRHYVSPVDRHVSPAVHPDRQRVRRPVRLRCLLIPRHHIADITNTLGKSKAILHMREDACQACQAWKSTNSKEPPNWPGGHKDTRIGMQTGGHRRLARCLRDLSRDLGSGRQSRGCENGRRYANYFKK